MDQKNKNATKRQAEHVGKVRLLTASERAELRRDMAEASAWMRAELARRRSMNK
jgi:CelD/BcsL family acetyltransferase involved in cellulose biosynthesis